jgi:hypothetical protein
MRRASLVLKVASLVAVAAGCDRVWRLDHVEGCPLEDCAAAGGQCGPTQVCEIECPTGTCTCPPGIDCQMDVRGRDVVVDCSDADACAVRCLDDGYCGNVNIRCGTGACTVQCSSNEFSCNEMSLECGLGPCSLTCIGLGSCQFNSSISCGLASSCSVSCGVDSCANLGVNCEQAEVCAVTCAPEGPYTCDGAMFQCQQAASCAFDCGGAPC